MGPFIFFPQYRHTSSPAVALLNKWGVENHCVSSSVAQLPLFSSAVSNSAKFVSHEVLETSHLLLLTHFDNHKKNWEVKERINVSSAGQASKVSCRKYEMKTHVPACLCILLSQEVDMKVLFYACHHLAVTPQLNHFCNCNSALFYTILSSAFLFIVYFPKFLRTLYQYVVLIIWERRPCANIWPSSHVPGIYVAC